MFKNRLALTTACAALALAGFGPSPASAATAETAAAPALATVVEASPATIAPRGSERPHGRRFRGNAATAAFEPKSYASASIPAAAAGV